MSRVVETKRFGMLIIGWTDMSDRFITRYFLRFKASRKFQAKRSYFMINVRKLALGFERKFFFQIRMYYYNPA